ncbi:hypothetical protein ACFWGM_32515 [Streptomyces roseolus]|uniref:hypothetical protein n=1 Tax=Streptomyces roseolus TaxID=67358 RepID=UPI0036456860
MTGHPLSRHHTLKGAVGAAAALTVAAATGAAPAAASDETDAETDRAPKATVVLVHGAFADAASEEEALELYGTFAVAAPGEPLFQAAAANLNPWTEAKVDTHAADRGPLLIISGEKDNTVPWAIANAAYKKQAQNEHAVTEITEIPGRGHSLTIDSGWREVADTALTFVRRFVDPTT